MNEKSVCFKIYKVRGNFARSVAPAGVIVINKSEIIEFLKNDADKTGVYGLADKTRKEYVGDGVHLRGLLEFSNICSRECFYCGLRAENGKLERYGMTKAEILLIAGHAVKNGYKTIVLQSGESNFYSVDTVCEIISGIKKYDVALTLSLGEKTFEEYKAYKDAGADRYLLRIETTDENLYSRLHPRSSFKNRVKCLENLKTLGYETGTGIMTGLPGQTIESIANDILFFKEIDADMVGIGPFIVHPDTPLKDEQNGSLDLALKTTALTRIVMKDINIPATSATETLHPNGRILALQSGANVVMPNVTSQKYRSKYEIYPGKICVNDNPDKCRGCIENKIKSIGRYVAQDCGFRAK